MTDDILAPLQQLALRHKHLEAEVYWFSDGVWSDAAGETLEAEEITFYAEGLLMEGFGLIWQVLADAEGPAVCRLFFWQVEATDIPALPEGYILAAEGRS